MANRKTARKGKDSRRRKDSIKDRIVHACAQCGAAVAAGALVCATCVIAATPAQARPRPAEPQSAVVKWSPAKQPHFSPFAGPEGLAGLLGDRPEDRDLPEPDVTLYPPGVFAAGTAVTATAPRDRGGRPWMGQAGP